MVQYKLIISRSLASSCMSQQLRSSRIMAISSLAAAAIQEWKRLWKLLIKVWQEARLSDAQDFALHGCILKLMVIKELFTADPQHHSLDESALEHNGYPRNALPSTSKDLPNNSNAADGTRPAGDGTNGSIQPRPPPIHEHTSNCG